MKILVIGDSCTDIFRYGKVERLAPEAPVPIIVPDREESNHGMAGNVVRNINALGHETDFVTNAVEIRTLNQQEKIAKERLDYLLKRAGNPETASANVDRQISAKSLTSPLPQFPTSLYHK